MTDVSGVTVTSAAQFIQQLSSLSGGGIPGWTLPGTNGAAIANVQQMISAGLADGTIKLTEITPPPDGGQLLTPDNLKGLTEAAGSGAAGAGVGIWMGMVDGAEIGVRFGPVPTAVGIFVGGMAGLLITDEAVNCFSVSFSQGGCNFMPVVTVPGVP